MDSIPVLFISGQSNLNPNEALRVRGVQMVDIIPMVKPITKYAWRKVADDYTRELMEDMIEQCLSGRPGPCWLDVPLDVQAVEI
jgi:acetolactate synthase-1/2/3 large subunit